MQRRLQTDVVEAAALCGGGCNPMWWRLQPYVVAAAALCGGGCSPMWWRLQPYASSREGRPSTCTPAGSPAVPCSAAAASASHESAPLASAAG